METKEEEQRSENKVKKLRFSDRDDVKELSRLSESSSLSHLSSKRYSGTDKAEKRNNSSQNGIISTLIPHSTTKEAFSEDLNQMWFIKRKEESELRACLSFKSRIFMFDKDRRASLRRHGVKKQKRKKLTFYPITKYFIYKSDTTAWYKGGIQYDFQIYTTKYISVNLSFNKFMKKQKKTLIFDDELRSRAYCLKRQRQIDNNSIETNNKIKQNFEARLEKIYSTISTTKRCLELIEELTRELKVLLESGNNRKITIEARILEDEYFRDAFLSYLKMSFLSKSMEKTSITKLFAHKYLSIEPEKARQSLIDLLQLLTESIDFNQYSVPEGHIIAFRKLSILFMRNKFFSRQDTRRARQLYQEESSMSKQSFDVNYSSYSYVDIMTQEVLDAEMYELLYPKTLLSEEWTGIDVEAFFMNPRKAWTFQKSKWALNIVKLISSGLITALMNNNINLRQDLMEFELSESINEQVSFVQSCVTNYVHKVEKRSMSRLKRKHSSTESIMFQDRKSIRSEFPSEYFFQFDNELDMTDLIPRYHAMLLPSSKAFVLEQVRGLGQKLDGFKDDTHEYAAYVDANAYSLFLNPAVRAELHYSRRRNCCYSNCTGHNGKLLLTLIRLGELASIEFLFQHGVKSNMRVCQGETKDIKWVDILYHNSHREDLKDKLASSRVSEVVSKSRKWQETYKKILAAGMSFFKPSNEFNMEDNMNIENDEATMLLTKYSKVSPLGVALTCFGFDLKHNRDIGLMREIITALLRANAQVTYNGNYAIRSLLPYVEATLASQKAKHRLVRRQTKEQNLDTQRRLTQQTRARNSSVFSKIMSSIGIKVSQDTRSVKFASAESTEDISRHEVLSFRSRGQSNGNEEQFIAQLLNRSKREASCLPNIDRDTIDFDLKWTILVRIELLYQCLIEEKYDLFRLLAPYSSIFGKKSVKGSIRPKSAVSEVDDVDPVTAECLFYLLQHLTFRMASKASTLFPKHLKGFCFVLQEYNLVPTRKQLTSVMASISEHIRTNRNCLPQTERTIIDLLSTGQAEYAFFFQCKEFYNERQITSFALYPNSRKGQQLTQTRRWKRQAKRIRRKMMKIALKAQLFDTFQLLFDKEGLKHFSPVDLTATFIDSLLVSKDSSNLAEMLRLLENRYGLSPELIAQPLLVDCISKDHAVHLVGVLVDLEIYPGLEECKTFILNSVKRSPFISEQGTPLRFDRVADLTKVKVFYKFLNHIMSKRPDSDHPKDVLDIMFYHQAWVTDLETFISSHKGAGQKEFIWYEGVQSIVAHLENFNLQLKKSSKAYDRYKGIRNEISRLRSSIASQIEGHIHQDMFYLEDEQKVVLKSIEEEGNRNSAKLGSSVGNSLSEIDFGGFVGNGGSNLLRFAEAMAVTNF